jgi:hypothetical protein
MRRENVKIRIVINLDHNILWELKVARMIVQVSPMVVYITMEGCTLCLCRSG